MRTPLRLPEALVSEGAADLGWWRVLNPAIYLISALPAVSVATLSPGTGPRGSGPLLGAALGTVLLQHGINVLNDVTDWRKGADAEKLDSWVRFHGDRPSSAAIHGYLSWLAGSALGLLVLLSAGKLRILLLATPLALVGFLYNHEARPIAYSRYSEWVTALCYGLGVFGCLWLLENPSITPVGACGIAAYAMLSGAVLIAHQPAQALTDAIAGKNTFAVRFGGRMAIRVARVLSTAAIAFLVAGCALTQGPPSFSSSCALAGLFVAHLLWHGPVRPARILSLSAAFCLASLAFRIIFWRFA